MSDTSVSDRRIDHLVIAVRDLEAAADAFRHLGFQVGQRNRHPWGTENRLIQFRSSFLELITVGRDAPVPPHEPGHFSFGAFVRDYLERREGLAMLVLDSPDAEADAATFSQRGIGRFEPFFFERQGRRPDGSETRVAFTLAFAMDPNLPDASFFVCQQHYPENFWNADFQKHPNGAVDVAEVTLAARDPASHSSFLSQFCGVPAIEADGSGVTLVLRNNARLQVEKRFDPTGLVAFSVAVPDLGRQSQILTRSGIAFGSSADQLGVDIFGVTVNFVASQGLPRPSL